MNSTALVDRLNFCSRSPEASGRNPLRRPKLLAAGILDRQAEPADYYASNFAPNELDQVYSNSPSGREEALSLMEQHVIGGAVSPKTYEVILKQIADSETASAPADPAQVLNTMAALILGSPEFQLR